MRIIRKAGAMLGLLFAMCLVACGQGETKSKALEPTTAPTLTATPTPTAVPSIDVSRLKNYENYDGLYVALEATNGASYESVRGFGDKLLICGSILVDNDSQASNVSYSKDLAEALEGEYESIGSVCPYYEVYDPYTNERLYSYIEKGQNCCYTHSTSESLVFFYDEFTKCRILNSELKQEYSFEIPKDIASTYRFFFCDQTFPFYSINTDKGELYVFDYVDGELKYDTIKTHYYEPSVLGVCNGGRTLIMSGLTDRFKNCAYAWDIEKDEITFIYDRSSDFVVSNILENGEIFICFDSNEGYWLHQDILGNTKYYYSENTSFALTNTGKFLSMQSQFEEEENGKESITLLGFHSFDGTSNSYLKFDSGFIPYDGVGKDLVVLMVDPGYTIASAGKEYNYMVATDFTNSCVLVWDTTVSDSRFDQSFESSDNYEELVERTGKLIGHQNNALAKLYERADSIGEKYGVNIYIADEVPEIIDTYSIEKCFESSVLETNLDRLESWLGNLPPNLFEQMKIQNVRDINIYLTSTLTGTGDNTLSYAGAFVNYGNTEIVMAIDCYGSYGMDYNFYHEVFHIIDHTMLTIAPYLKYDYSDEAFKKLNPSGFDYLNSYTAYSDFQDSGDYYNLGYYNYFMDAYGLTYPGEDKAIIFGHACDCYYDSTYSSWSDIFSFDVINEKYKYLCKSIREVFDTTGWPEVTIWEIGLEGNG